MSWRNWNWNGFDYHLCVYFVLVSKCIVTSYLKRKKKKKNNKTIMTTIVLIIIAIIINDWQQRRWNQWAFVVPGLFVTALIIAAIRSTFLARSTSGWRSITIASDGQGRRYDSGRCYMISTIVDGESVWEFGFSYF